MAPNSEIWLLKLELLRSDVDCGAKCATGFTKALQRVSKMLGLERAETGRRNATLIREWLLLQESCTNTIGEEKEL